MDRRTRRFIYQYENPDEETITFLQEINCVHNIYGYKENVLHGFITFKYTKTEKAASKMFKTDCMKITKDSIKTLNEIKSLSNVWEKGEPPRRVKTKELTTDDTIAILLKQNSTLINMAINNITHLQSQNERFEKVIIEKPAPQITNSINNTNNDHSKNKRITNINVFLNTECKDAITLRDFIDKLVIQDEDLECMKQLGYVESVTQLLKRSLKEYSLHERPIHCTDVKREVMHVKDQEGWKKETPLGESPNIDKALRQITHKHRRKLADTYREITHESANFEEKAKVMYQVATAGTEENKYKKKIIKNITDEIRLSGESS